MSKALKGALLFAVAMMLLAGGSAQAQQNCALCDPYGMCGVTCWTCSELVDPQYGACPEYAYSETTCDAYIGACNQWGCTPNWQETNRQNVGTYGESTWGFWSWGGSWNWYFGCNHHRVDRVTDTDLNECNINEQYWERTYCDDWVDWQGTPSTTHPPSCCTVYTCNDWHSCF